MLLINYETDNLAFLRVKSFIQESKKGD